MKKTLRLRGCSQGRKSAQAIGHVVLAFFTSETELGEAASLVLLRGCVARRPRRCSARGVSSLQAGSPGQPSNWL
jgi:hypothetical protein